MRRYVLPLAIPALLAAPVANAEDSMLDGLMERGARMLLQGMMDEMRPHMAEIARFTQFFEQLGDLNDYAAPEILPNGDILIRRKPGAPPLPEPGEGGEIDL